MNSFLASLHYLAIHLVSLMFLEMKIDNLLSNNLKRILTRIKANYFITDEFVLPLRES